MMAGERVAAQEQHALFFGKKFVSAPLGEQLASIHRAAERNCPKSASSNAPSVNLAGIEDEMGRKDLFRVIRRATLRSIVDFSDSLRAGILGNPYSARRNLIQ